MNISESPKVGQYWAGKGGIYLGVIADGDRQWHLILATTPESNLRGEWGGYGNTVEGEFSFADGQHNTNLLLASNNEHPILEKIKSLTIEGHNDFYFPAQKENNLIYINAQQHVDQTWHWSSTQCSAYGAWIQGFEGGRQGVDYEDGGYAVRAVRRELII